MARNADVTVGFRGDDTQLQRTFDDVGAGAREMGRDIERAADDTRGGFDNLGEGIDASESKFRGLGDTIGGTADIMDGFKEGNIAGIAMGFADLAGGITEFVIPALTAMKGALLTGLAPALTAISAHPLIAAILIGGAIIAGLILLEKKFGIVTKAVEFLREKLTSVFDWISNNWRDLANILTFPFRGIFELFARGWNATVGGFRIAVPDWVPLVGGKAFQFPTLPIPKFHSGGVVPGAPGTEMLAMLQAGETVVPRGGGGGVTIIVQGSVITERDLGRVVADALRNNQLIGVT